jgi:molecular chaperone IbpA
MRQFTLRPFHSSHLGFEHIFNEIEYMLTQGQTVAETAGYPPFNVFKDGDNYTIEMAIAGFKKQDVSIEHDRRRGILNVSGQKTESAQPENREQLKKGIGTRSFRREFTLADDLEVTGAALEDGILSVRLNKIVREEDKPLVIDIN